LKTKISALILICGLLVSCGAKVSTPAPPKTPLQKAAIAEADIAAVIGQIQTALINGNQQGVIPDSVVSSVLSVTVKVAQADQQATNITKGLATLTPDQQKNIAAIFTPIAAAVSDSINNGLLPIKNANTQATVRALLVTLQTTIAGLQIAMGGN
jgi:hypothetical protein